jgi:3-phenylpropionate/trans-cinnamate dioxygenase ferredoxin reductase subunit
VTIRFGGRPCLRKSLFSNRRAAKTVRLRDGRDIAYDKLLLAAGAMPRRLPLAGPNSCLAYLRTFDDALATCAHMREGRRIAIIGAGFIGLELAASRESLGRRLLSAKPSRGF